MSPPLAIWRLAAVLFLAALPVCASAAPGQEDSEPYPLRRDTPRGTVTGYLEAIDRGEFEVAAEHLDLRHLPATVTSYTPVQIARGLSLVLQRAMWIDPERLSDDPRGNLEDGLPPNRDEIGVINTVSGAVPVLLQRTPGPGGTEVWKFSSATLARLPELYEAYRYNPYVEWLARHVPTVSVFGVELFKWLSALSLTAVATPLVLLAAAWLARIVSGTGNPLHPHVRWLFTRPVSLLLLFWIFHQTLLNLGIGAQAQRIAQGQTLLILLSLWVVWAAIDVLREAYGQRLARLGRPAGLPLLRPVATALKCVFVLLGLLMWLDNLGYEITALLTGLGVGGLAVALVLQRPLEDLLGAISLYTQQPVRIGDFGHFGGYSGTIEEISLRTTRIRTLENTVVSVPNARMASEPIENLSARTRILYQPVLHLRSDTDPDRLEMLLASIRELLDAHDHVISDGARVRFTGIGTEGFEVRIFAYVDVTDWARYLEIAERLNFSLLEKLHEADVVLTVPLNALLEGVSK